LVDFNKIKAVVGTDVPERLMEVTQERLINSLGAPATIYQFMSMASETRGTARLSRQTHDQTCAASLNRRTHVLAREAVPKY
jgi:hypothetical protein